MDKRHEEFFEVMDSDVYCTFRGDIAKYIKGGKKNVLYGKSVNLNELYNRMIDDVVEYVQSEGFWDKEKTNDSIVNKVNGYSVSKYGVTIEWVYKKLNGRLEDVNYNLTTDILFEMMIERVGGVDRIEWNRLYDTIQFYTSNESILEYIGKRTLSNSVYGYFVDRHKLKIVGVKNRVKKYNKGEETRLVRSLILNWEYKGVSKEKYLDLNRLLRNKRDWWTYMCTKGNSSHNGRSRSEICDYDILLGGRREDEVLPERCPIDRNIVLNYTTIDFSCGRFNLDECKSNSGEMETWSMASVDRIDSQRNYAYDNVEIISYYYNMIKGCANFDQLSKLYHYQKNRNSFI